LEDRGRIQVDQRADLVLIGADPFVDIDAVKDIRGVVLAGRYLDNAALAGLREWVATNRNRDFGSLAVRADLEMRYWTKRDPEDAERLARYCFALGDYADAATWFSRVAALGADPALARLGRFNAVLNDLVMNKRGTCEDLLGVAQGYLDDQPDASTRLQAQLRVGNALIAQSGCRPALTKMVADLKGAGGDKLPSSTLLDRDRFFMEYHARIDKNGALALQYRDRTLPPGWREDATDLNETAWWLFENGIALEDAEGLARHGIALSEEPNEKAAILDTLAEIENARGDPHAALITIRKAMVLSEHEYFREQEKRFADLAAELIR
jgi:tetratricopeptide (TPR) repeat protein